MRVKMSIPPPPAPTASAIGPCPIVIKIVGRPGTGFGWLVGFGFNGPLRQYFSLYQVVSQRFLVCCFGFNGPLRHYFSPYRAVSQREGERRKKG